MPPPLVADPVRDRARRRVVVLMGAYYVLLVGEGALRKWVFPGAEKALYFLRDPIVLWAILIAMRHRLVAWTPFAGAILGIGAALALAGCWHIIDRGVPPIVIAFGFRMYVISALLPLLMLACLTRADVERFVRLTLWMCLPMALLAIAQWKAPPTAWINRQPGGGEAFTVAKDVVRVTGTFTFTAGFVQFVAAGLACLAAAALARIARPWLLLASALGMAACFATSGSRGVLFHAGATAATVVGAEMARPLQRQRPAFYIGAVLMVAGLVAAVWLIFPQAIEHLESRQRAANDSEDTGGRVVGILTSGLDQVANAGLLGDGIGAASPIGSALTAGLGHGFAEDEFGRVVLECGVPLGFAYMLMRWGLAASIALGGMRAMRDRADPLTLMLLSYAGLALGVGQITSQGTINGYGWFFTGLAMVAATKSPSAPAPVGATATAAARPRELVPT